MEKFIPYEKLSKKQKKALNAQKRGTWGSFDPTTRKPQNSKAYNVSVKTDGDLHQQTQYDTIPSYSSG